LFDQGGTDNYCWLNHIVYVGCPHKRFRKNKNYWKKNSEDQGYSVFLLLNICSTYKGAICQEKKIHMYF
jgi:hypothetical protein